MDNFDLDRPAPKEVDDELIPFEDIDPPPGKSGISHTPLNLGGPAKPAPAAKESQPKAASPPPTPAPQPKPAPPAAVAPTAAPAERITGVRTFFTKLHAGAIDFLDQQITDWLAKNPDIHIKRTNTIYGEVTGKKVESNIIISVWY